MAIPEGIRNDKYMELLKCFYHSFSIAERVAYAICGFSASFVDLYGPIVLDFIIGHEKILNIPK